MGELGLRKTEERNLEEQKKNQGCGEKRQREKSLGRNSTIGIYQFCKTRGKRRVIFNIRVVYSCGKSRVFNFRCFIYSYDESLIYFITLCICNCEFNCNYDSVNLVLLLQLFLVCCYNCEFNCNCDSMNLVLLLQKL